MTASDRTSITDPVSKVVIGAGRHRPQRRERYNSREAFSSVYTDETVVQACSRGTPQIEIRPITTRPFFGMSITMEPLPECGLLPKLPIPSPPNSCPSLLKI